MINHAPFYTVYHGTNELIDRFDQSKSRVINDYYGGGVAYFTESLESAHTYANGAYKRKNKGERYVYVAQLSAKKIFDVDDTFTGKDLQKFFQKRTDVELLARGAGLLTPKEDKYVTIGKLEAGEMELTGDQIFKGLSKGMNFTSKVTEFLKTMNYDTLRYNAGGYGIPKHSIYIAYDSSNIKIVEQLLFDSAGNKFSKK